MPETERNSDGRSSSRTGTAIAIDAFALAQGVQEKYPAMPFPTSPTCMRMSSCVVPVRGTSSGMPADNRSTMTEKPEHKGGGGGGHSKGLQVRCRGSKGRGGGLSPAGRQ